MDKPMRWRARWPPYQESTQNEEQLYTGPAKLAHAPKHIRSHSWLRFEKTQLVDQYQHDGQPPQSVERRKMSGRG